MSAKELERVKILSQVKDKKLNQVVAAKQLGITDRQVRNLLKQINAKGVKGVISKKRGRPGDNRKSAELKSQVLQIVASHYGDFGPKLANEYLKTNYKIFISNETLRQWMISAGMWQLKMKKRHLHPLRERRRAFGELVQIDGSHHYWFEDRGPACVLIVYIDDATSKITSLYFAESESLEAYYQGFSRHLRSYGRPLSLYGDKCSVLTARCPKDAQSATQFQMALRELDCKLLFANSPQGRVERANRTLQDRLVKHLRLKEICSIKEGNDVLEEYRREHNLLFSKKPSEQLDAHRSLDGISIEQVLSTRTTRTLTKDNTLQFENTFYQIFAQDNTTHLYKKGKIEIRRCLDGTQIARFKKKRVLMIPLGEVEAPTFNEKQIRAWEPKKTYIPPQSHPYKRSYRERGRVAKIN